MNAFLATRRRDRLSLYFEHSEGWGSEGLAHTGQWPAWQPGREAYAISVMESTSRTSRIEVRSARHELLGIAFKSQPGEPMAIGPRVPHYVSWASSGQALSYVAATAAGLSHFVVTLAALDVARPTVVGAPIFSTWIPGGAASLVHVADRLVLVDAETGSVEPLEAAAVGFRAPAVSSDGQLVAFCRRAGDGIELCVGATRASTFDAVAAFSSGLVMAFRPGTHDLVVATTTDATSGVFDALQLTPAAGGSARPLWRGPFVSCAWHPEGERVIVVVPTQMGDGRYALNSVSPEGQPLAATEGFVPSDESRAAFGFFDQYLQSHCAWSPDGRYFGLAGRCAADGISGSLGDPSGPFALLWEPAARSALQLIGPASFVSFPPPLVNTR